MINKRSGVSALRPRAKIFVGLVLFDVAVILIAGALLSRGLWRSGAIVSLLLFIANFIVVLVASRRMDAKSSQTSFEERFVSRQRIWVWLIGLGMIVGGLVSLAKAAFVQASVGTVNGGIGGVLGGALFVYVAKKMATKNITKEN
jgi:hypothetical protein